MTALVWPFKLCIVSPLVMGGAAINTQEELAELRVPSVRGALRSWYRVLAGTGPEATRRELALFGGAGNGQGQGLLSLSLGTVPPSDKQDWAVQSTQQGLKYLSYSLTLGDNRRRYVPPADNSATPQTKAPRRSGSRRDEEAPKEHEIALRFVFRRGLPHDDAPWLLWSFWLLTHLGGVGSRARRGFGSLGITEWPSRATDLLARERPELELPSLPHVTRQSSFMQARGTLERGIRMFNEFLARQERIAPTAQAPHYYWNERSKVVWWLGQAGRGWRSWEAALDDIGKRLMDFRRGSGVDGPQGSALQQLASGKALERAPWRTAFGLPLAFPSRRGQQYELIPYLEAEAPAAQGSKASPSGDSSGGVQSTSGKMRQRDLEPGKYHRLPSPLLIRLLRCSEGYGLVLTRLSGPLPGVDVAVVEKGQVRGYAAADPTNDLLDRFLRELPEACEVQP
ncbi:MAG: hypothetical protein JW940_14650 [Polyangiaceae bacterium]|nr:hypothetical protein [Polyangiaceae bacterium]